MIQKIEKLIDSIYYVPYTKEAFGQIESALKLLTDFVNSNHFLKNKTYLSEIEDLEELVEGLSNIRSDEDRLLQKRIQKNIANLARTILDENKKIFIVHGRNINMRDKISSLLGRLKIDYVILETEYNNGATVIEKFIKNACDCRYAIVLFSADDVGRYDDEKSEFKSRTRQNVIMELGYFLGLIGRKNITILHETRTDIEKPSDFDGIVYEPFDEYGAWKSKIIKEMKRAGIYIDEKLADRI
jgi:predicted nucleotide-binding protein